MTQDSFKLLLEDLYTVYNYRKLKDIPMLMKKYNGREFEAIKVIFIQYNSPYSDSHNPDYGTENHIKYLINSYSAGNRVFSKEKLEEEQNKEAKLKEEQHERKQKESEKKATEKLKNLGKEVQSEIEVAVNKQIALYFKEQKEEIDKRLEDIFIAKNQEIEKYFAKKEKEIQEKLQSVPNLIASVAQAKSNVPKENNKILVKITNLNFGEADLDLPGEEIMKQMGIGERIVVKDSQGNVCGVGIKDVTYDNVSFDENEEDGKILVKDISLEKLA